MNKYQLISKLAEGAEGIVYLARATSGLELVSIKAVPKKLDQHRFDYRCLLGHNCPSLIRFDDLFEEGELTYFVMEYCPRGDLCDYIMEEGELSEDKARTIFVQLCQAVHYLHQKQLLHNDIKLENIVLRDDGSVALIDFGFTCPMGRRYSSGFYGSILYTSPEVLDVHPTINEKSDLWGVGVVLFAILTGCFPFYDSRLDQRVISRKIRNGRVKYPDRLSKEVVDLLSRLLTPLPLRLDWQQLWDHPWVNQKRSSL